jgi:hypothetical protein
MLQSIAERGRFETFFLGNTMALFGKERFVFENYGGSYQLRIQSADDLAALETLDDPFWIATSAPINQFTCDPVLLKRLDADKNGRLQTWEIRKAAAWLLSMLRNKDAITARQDTLELESLDTTRDGGKRLLDAANQVLQNLGECGAATVSLAQVRDRQTIFASGIHNGDGVIPADSIGEPELEAFARDVMACVGAATDINGSEGVDRSLLDTFIESAKALLGWHDEFGKEGRAEALLPFGAETAQRHVLYQSVASVIAAYFAQCRVVALNTMLGRTPEEKPCPADAFVDEEQAAAYLGQAPLAAPRADGLLMVQGEVNPYFADILAEFADSVAAPLLGDEFNGEWLEESQWQAVMAAFAPYEEWLASKSGGQVETLGLDKLRSYLASDLPIRLGALIESDLDAGEELEALNDLEYLMLLQRWFLDICNNFVGFPCLYDPSRHAMIEMGRLVMDGRIFAFNFRVTDIEAHSVAAERSGIYLLYSEVTGGPEDKPFAIVTPVTRGPVLSLCTGKRGVLFDLAGRQWDTRVVKVVENPVSLRRAITAPFKRVGGLISSTAERITSGAEQQIQAQINQATTVVETGIKEGATTAQTAPAPTPPAAQAAPAPGVGGMRDMVLTGGFLVAMLGSSFAFIAKTFSGMESRHVWTALGVGLALLVVVLTPTVVIAFFRLRRRNLSAILEASGWAINAPMRLTHGLCRIIVQKPWRSKRFVRERRDLTRDYARTVADTDAPGK